MNSFLHAFPGQEKNETTYIFTRPYYVSFIPVALFYLLVIGLCILIQWSIRLGWIMDLTPEITNWIVSLLGITELFATLVFFIAIFDFYADIFIVTDRRLTEIQQEQLLYRKYAQLSLEDIEDVKSSAKGFMQTVFGYGDVLIQTAGEQNNFLIDNIQYPHEISALILDLSEQAKRGVVAEGRFPQHTPVAFLNDIPVHDINQLKSLGAMAADDNRHTASGQAPVPPTAPPTPAQPTPPPQPEGTNRPYES